MLPVMKHALLAGLLLVIASGCASSRSFDLVVENKSNEPVTIWLTKDGTPFERNWLSPEQVAMAGLDKNGQLPFVPLPPGKTASPPRFTGQFDSGCNAILRVYRGARKFSELLAISAGSSFRQDVVLKPGKNHIVIGNGTEVKSE